MPNFAGGTLPRAPASPEGPPPTKVHPHMRAEPLLETTGEPRQYIAMPDPNWLHISPGHLSLEIGHMANAFTM